MTKFFFLLLLFSIGLSFTNTHKNAEIVCCKGEKDVNTSLVKAAGGYNNWFFLPSVAFFWRPRLV